MQQEMCLLGDVKGEVREVDWRLVRQCRTEQAAMRLCVQLSRVRRTQECLAKVLGLRTRSTLNTILNSDYNKRPRHMSRKMQADLQVACGNRAIDQWASLYERGGLAHQQTEQQRINELRQELAALESSLSPVTLGPAA